MTGFAKITGWVAGAIVAVGFSGMAAAQPLAGPPNASPTWITIQQSGSAAPQTVLVWVPVGASGEPAKPSGLLMQGRNIDLLSTGGHKDFGKLGTFGSPRTLFNLNSDSLDRRFPLRSYDGGQTFTRDPGKGTGRRDRAHAWRVKAAEDYRERQRLMQGAAPGVTLWSTGDSGAVGLNWGRMADGRMVLLKGDFGELHLDALRAEGSYQAEFHVNAEGVDLETHVGGRATLVGVHAQTGKAQVGGRGLGAGISGQGRAGVVAEGEGDLNLIADASGVRAKVGGQLFAGAKADGELPIEISILGVRFVATPNGYVAAGAGINGDAYAGLGTNGVKAGCKLGGCLGLGAGAGVDLEIDVSGVVDFFDSMDSGSYRPPEDFKPRVLRSCGGGMYEVSTVNCIGQRIVQRWPASQAEPVLEQERRQYDLTSFFANPRSGASPGRYADTKMSPADLELLQQFIRGAGKAKKADGAGMLRD